MKIGVFDSGIGGLSVANAIRAELPELDVNFVNDTQNVPYGSKSPEQLFELVLPILKSMQADGCQVIVIACNTVTTTIIAKLREELSIPLVAVEPMVKPAAEMTQAKIIAVCATPTTLASPRYNELKRDYANGITVLEPDCSQWSAMIEGNDINQDAIAEQIESVCQQGADVIVLGCTHYHWIEDEIKQVADKYGAKVIQPEAALVAQLRKVLAQLP
jgi:glutamate racemase